MDKAINEALKGNYTEAEILFNELKDIVNDGTVENNLAVLLETEKRNKEAMNMYINALIKSPGNYIFRSNFVSFICLNRYSKRN
jgi:Flp pilus assembly protein TadD